MYLKSHAGKIKDVINSLGYPKNRQSVNQFTKINKQFVIISQNENKQTEAVLH